MCLSYIFVFFFKQKTAYEMRISDWSSDVCSSDLFYHADTPTHAIRAYDVDKTAGTLAGGRLFHQFEHGNGRPDGGAVDAEGCYWSALWDGWRVVRFSPAGELLQTVELPVQRPTMIAFGGPDLKTEFVTSAGKNLTEP